MNRRTMLLLSVLPGLIAPRALACGVCIEDKVAATYDHAIAGAAQARHHAVVFAQVEGQQPGTVLVEAAAAAARRVHGVQAQTIRTSSEPATLSFALDPGKQRPDQAIGAIGRMLAARHMRIVMLSVLQEGKFINR